MSSRSFLIYLSILNFQVIITNELTTRCVGGNSWIVCPALGDSHAHKINTRLLLSRDQNEENHIVMIDKSVLCNKVAFRFMVCFSFYIL